MSHLIHTIFREDFVSLIVPTIWDTLYMVLFTTIFSILLGLPIGILLTIFEKKHISPHPNIYKVLDFIVNILRSFPFVILIIILIPLSKFIVGTSIGTTATIVPLAIAAAPFVGRVIENSLKELDWGLIESAQAMGANKLQIIFKVMIPEALPSLLGGLTLTIINIIGYSALAGVVGGGGLGDLAFRYGYQGFDTYVLVWTVILLIVLVQLVQTIGNIVVRLIVKKRNH